MKTFSVGLFFSGIALIGLSGLEKILIYLAYRGNIDEIQTLIDLTPPYIWNITNVTFGVGITAIVISLLITFQSFYNRGTSKQPPFPNKREADNIKRS